MLLLETSDLLIRRRSRGAVRPSPKKETDEASCTHSIQTELRAGVPRVDTIPARRRLCSFFHFQAEGRAPKRITRMERATHYPNTKD